MKVRDIMTKAVITLGTDDTVEKAASAMKEHNIGVVPVCESGRVVGVVTDRDITLRTVAVGQDPRNQYVRDIMSSNPVTGSPDMTIDEISRLMSERQIKRIPIVENNNTLIGVIALGDLAVRPNLNREAEYALSSISEPSTPEY
ncbi:CBS domain-containing protein [Clostridium sp. DJ247]|uniref:CBS domain-containing protein n=1 Tax=Clostridium sp. DJ247 TaxID=2726188 RepID=UPI0016287FD6|nr:CBS domain-containing protein [Clostridium sp. DJ247]MBC2581527.1 CBS domain-containing protein [Clostridium sp. DJ247]